MSDTTDKVNPDPEDYAVVERKFGQLPWNATLAQQANHYRRAQAAKLLRLLAEQESTCRN
jgi:hypothetical protein